MLETRGAAAAKAFGMLAASGVNPNAYIENLFSTYLYTGNGATQTITNGIDLSTKGGLTWIKWRAGGSNQNHALFDTARGATKFLSSNVTDGSTTAANSLTSFNTDGFSLGTDSSYNYVNSSQLTYASWTFRKQAKFFDVVTYTGTGANTTIAHNLGSTPGCIIVKRTDTTSNWQVYHSGLTSAAYSIQLNLTNGQASAPTIWNSTAPTSSVFSVGTDTTVNASGGTYVAYLFASNAGGFGAAGTDNVITCGMVPAGSTSVTLGWEPQFVLIKSVGTAYPWEIYDTFRGLTTIGGISQQLEPNSTSAEASQVGACNITATGMRIQDLTPSTDRIYIAIRRGPMKTPTDATKVFSPIIESTAGTTYTPGFTVDLQIQGVRSGGGLPQYFIDRLRGLNSTTSDSINVPYLSSASTSPETPQAGFFPNNMWNTTYVQRNNSFNPTNVDWNFARAPGFFDEVCYTGTSPGTGSWPINHNLGVTPELIIYRQRDSYSSWQAGTNFTATNWRSMFLNRTNAGSQTTYATNDWFAAQPTSTTFTVGWNYYTTGNYVAYLFATCPGVSKVGSYSGTGATQTINCGFTGGARFVLIKRTDSTGDWYVWDTARGMVAGTDPYLWLDSGSSETNANNVYTTSVGFQIVGTDAGINANGGTYIFLAIS